MRGLSLGGKIRAERGHRRGFTLLEIMVVVVIISLLAAIAAVQYQRARVNTFEQLALQSIRLVGNSCQMYLVTNQRFPDDLTSLGAPTVNPPYLQPDLIGNGTSAIKQGYQFTYASIGGGSSFTLLADPVSPGVTGNRHFFIDPSLVIRFNATQPATASDPAVN